MREKPDAELLREYMDHQSDAAFAEIVARYTDLVYSAALRQVNSPDAARDVAQTVFTDLARKAAALASRLRHAETLVGWLYRSTRYAALTDLRDERRRQTRERQAMQHLETESASSPDWDRLRPMLDEAISRLRPDDRDALLLRFFRNEDFHAVGAALGVSDDAAQKRVSRALEKLRFDLTRRGFSTTGVTLATVLSAHAVQVAPAGLAAVLANASLAGAATGTGTTLTLLKLMATTKLKAGVIGAMVLAGVVAPLMVQHQTQMKLREENQRLRQQVAEAQQLAAENERKLLAELKNPPALRLPAPMVVMPAATPEPEDLRATNLITHLVKGGDLPRLTPQQLESYLQQNRRSAASLLSAFRVTGEAKLLQEAMEKFPEDPEVAFAAVFKKDASPEERRQWLETFKRTAPDNALASYLSALNHFKDGRASDAVQDLLAAAARPRFQDFSSDFVQNDEEAWRAAGYSVAEAKTVSSMALILPHLAPLKELGQNLVALANSYRQSGDDASAQAALQMGFQLGQHLDGSPGQALINQLVGIAIQSMSLRAMDPNGALGSDGRTVQEHLDDLTRQRSAIKELTTQFGDVQQKITDQDWISYKDRWRAFGEIAAARWVIDKYRGQ